jgi:transposase-like protein
MSVTGPRTRKRRAIQEKLEIVRETLQSEASVAVIARRHGVNANQVFTWRRQYQRGQLKGRPGTRATEAMVMPVQIAELPRVRTPSSTAETDRVTHASPRIEIELASGPRVKIWDIGSETVRELIRELVRPCRAYQPGYASGWSRV